VSSKILFVDRDGTIIREPHDFQVDAIEKVRLVPDVMASLQLLLQHGYQLVMITNQDGLGTERFPQENFQRAHDFILDAFASQGIVFEDILICPHFLSDKCACRKPLTGMVQDYIIKRRYDLEQSYVIGDRETDLELAKNMGIVGLKLDDGKNGGISWKEITQTILNRKRIATVKRKTNETEIEVKVNLDPVIVVGGAAKAPAIATGATSTSTGTVVGISTGIGFYDHMLEQIAKHAGIELKVKALGDLEVDWHHTIEDVALALGSCLDQALGERRGIERYSFWLPMDEASTEMALDLAGRPSCQIEGSIPPGLIHNFPSEMAVHFFESLCQTLKATLHIRVRGKNSHHMVESMFKAFGRVLAAAIAVKNGSAGGASVPSTKGVL
jgi:imidazoleglycerol-phosphate dehydratase/histidinol-phosphatase